MSYLKNKMPDFKKDKLPEGWIATSSKSRPDRVYYYNLETKVSTWKKPDPRKRDRLQVESSQNTNNISKKQVTKRKFEEEQNEMGKKHYRKQTGSTIQAREQSPKLEINILRQPKPVIPKQSSPPTRKTGSIKEDNALPSTRQSVSLKNDISSDLSSRENVVNKSGKIQSPAFTLKMKHVVPPRQLKASTLASTPKQFNHNSLQTKKLVNLASVDLKKQKCSNKRSSNVRVPFYDKTDEIKPECDVKSQQNLKTNKEGCIPNKKKSWPQKFFEAQAKLFKALQPKLKNDVILPSSKNSRMKANINNLKLVYNKYFKEPNTNNPEKDGNVPQERLIGKFSNLNEEQQSVATTTTTHKLPIHTYKKPPDVYKKHPAQETDSAIKHVDQTSQSGADVGDNTISKNHHANKEDASTYPKSKKIKCNTNVNSRLQDVQSASNLNASHDRNRYINGTVLLQDTSTAPGNFSKMATHLCRRKSNEDFHKESGALLQPLDTCSSGKGGKVTQNAPSLKLEPSHMAQEVSTDSFVGDVPSAVDKSPVCDAEMEWETSVYKEVLFDIQLLRNHLQQEKWQPLKQVMSYSLNLNTIESNQANVLGQSTCDQPNLLIVIDTNVFISNLGFVEEILETNFKDIGYPVLVIPWIVLQELDLLKQNRIGNGKQTLSKMSTEVAARKAVSYLNSKFSSHHPRVRGQSRLEASRVQFKNEVADDGIFQCCLQLKDTNDTVVLLSNDKNLCNKAFVNGVNAFSKEEFNRRFFPDTSLSPFIENTTSEVSKIVKVERSKETIQADTIFTQMESLLKKLFTLVVETEMHSVYDKMWRHIVIVKPPWKLADLFTCFFKHWIAVFGFVFPKKMDLYLRDLKESIHDGVQSLKDAENIVKQSLNLCYMLPSTRYGDVLPSVIQQMNELLKYSERDGKEIKSETVMNNIATDLDNEQVLQIVFTVFNNIWQYASYFCGILYDVLGYEHQLQFSKPIEYPSVTEVQAKLPEFYSLVHTFIESISSVLNVPRNELTPSHQAVLKLHTTLVTSIPGGDASSKAVTQEHVVIFCVEERARKILEVGQQQYMELELMINNGINYFVKEGFMVS